jgi:hypothetical protein
LRILATQNGLVKWWSEFSVDQRFRGVKVVKFSALAQPFLKIRKKQALNGQNLTSDTE